jgi:hypothetical protein
MLRGVAQAPSAPGHFTHGDLLLGRVGLALLSVDDAHRRIQAFLHRLIRQCLGAHVLRAHE